ncbi:MAG: methyltransferase domain-containing protein [Anaerolineales bacterium]
MSSGNENEIRACRVCMRAELQPILSLGATPLANALVRQEDLDQIDPIYPLDLVLCPHCSLVQITETVPPEVLFREYAYFSSFSDTMLEHSRDLVEHLIRSRALSPESLAVEVASNDGYLLQYFQSAGVPVLGIEPAINIAKVAEEKGIATLAEFFDDDLAMHLSREGRLADVLIANNVLAHVANLHGFVEGVRILLKPGGTGVFEAAYVRDMIEYCEFDQVYHEHLCYYSLTALSHLFDQHELCVVDVERIPVHGGSLRVYVEHSDAAVSGHRVAELLMEEQAWGVLDKDSYSGFADRVRHRRQAILDLLADLKRRGQRIVGYGAAAKGSILLNTFGIDGDTLDYVVDRSTHKQGLYMPGTHLPICAPERLLEDKPDYVLMLAWNFADEILEQQAEYRKLGGQFIIPIPELRIL